MATTSRARRAFAEMVRRPDAEIDLVRGALLIAMEEYPQLDISEVLDEIDILSRRVALLLSRPAVLAAEGPDALLSSFLRPRPTRQQVIEAINRVLFEEEGFHGNLHHYGDPRNSFLNDVLHRRTGIPITLSVLYIEVAHRAGYELVGVGMPGHFIVGFPASDATATGDGPRMIYVDPFGAGAQLSLDDCRAYFGRLYGPEYPFTRDVLAPITRHQILSRMLNNLKVIYLQQRDYKRAISVVDRLLLMEPGAVWELKTRGLLYYRLGSFLPALSDLRRYLKLAPASEETDLLNYYVDFLKRLLVMAN